MGASRLVIASIVFSLLVAGVWAEEAAIDDGIAEPEASDSALKQELELLRSKIEDLGQSGLDLVSFPFRAVDPVLGRALFLLCIPKKGALDAEELLGKAYARAAELEKQVVGTRTAHYLAVPLKIDCWRSISAVGGRFWPSAVDFGRRQLIELEKGKKKKKRKRKKNEEKKKEYLVPARRPRSLAIAARGSVTCGSINSVYSKTVTYGIERGILHESIWFVIPWCVARYGRCILLSMSGTYRSDRGPIRVVHRYAPMYLSNLLQASDKSAQAQKWLEPHLEIVKTVSY
ncbi:hypothetical protein GW17_00037368 [Ensete ventricosum]|nr:hypothetical protein GW17_00037368 [Ensete ventricosum]